MRSHIWKLVVCLAAAGAPLAFGDEKTKQAAFKKFAEMQAQRVRAKQAPLTILDLIDMYTVEDKQEILRKTVVNNGVFVPFRGRWELIDDPSLALPWAYHEQEPFPDKVVTVLESTFAKTTNEQQRFRKAALLYRNRRKIGEDYLLGRLAQEGNELAALILVLNRTTRALPLIPRVIGNREPSSPLIDALGKWGGATSDWLARGLREQRGSPVDYLRALAYPGHETDRETIDFIQAMFARTTGVTKIASAAAIVRLNPAAADRPLAYLEERLSETPLSDSEEFFIVRALSQVGSPAAVQPAFRRLVNAYTASDSPQYATAAQIQAALRLARIGNRRDQLLVVEMLTKMHRERLANKRDANALALVILERGFPDAERLVSNIMGASVVETLKGTRGLRKLPGSLLPILSRSFVGPSFFDDGAALTMSLAEVE